MAVPDLPSIAYPPRRDQLPWRRDLQASTPSTRASTRRDWRTPLEMLLLGGIWGGSFLFMRIAAPHFGPAPLVQLRLLFGALLLLPFLWRARARLTRAHWLRFIMVGALSCAVPYTLFAWAAERAPAGIEAIANSMTALFATLVAFACFGEKIGRRRGMAMVAAFVGVVVLASGKTSGAEVGLAAGAGTLAALCYGIAANLIKHYLADLPATAVASGTLLCAAIMVMPLAVATWPAAPIPVLSWISAVLLGLLCTGVAYGLYFRLIDRVGAPRATTVAYLIPVFGVAWAWLFLGEPVTWTMVVSGVLILGSVIASQRGARVASKAPVRALPPPVPDPVSVDAPMPCRDAA